MITSNFVNWRLFTTYFARKIWIGAVNSTIWWQIGVYLQFPKIMLHSFEWDFHPLQISLTIIQVLWSILIKLLQRVWKILESILTNLMFINPFVSLLQTVSCGLLPDALSDSNSFFSIFLNTQTTTKLAISVHSLLTNFIELVYWKRKSFFFLFCLSLS